MLVPLSGVLNTVPSTGDSAEAHAQHEVVLPF